LDRSSNAGDYSIAQSPRSFAYYLNLLFPIQMVLQLKQLLF